MEEQIQRKRTLDEIPMREYMVVVASLLKDLGISEEMAVGIIAAVSSSKMLIGQFMLYLYDNKPTEEQIMHWIVEHT